jgi:hypothetical protein
LIRRPTNVQVVDNRFKASMASRSR